MVQPEKFGANIIVFLILIASTMALSDSITLNYPKDRTQILDNSTNKIDFEYSITNINRIENCTLYVKGEPKKTETIIFQNNNNTMSLFLEDDYNYYWQIKCYDSLKNKLSSKTQFFIKGVAPNTSQEEPAPPTNESVELDIPSKKETPKKQISKIEQAWSKIPYLSIFSVYEFILAIMIIGTFKYYFRKR